MCNVLLRLTCITDNLKIKKTAVKHILIVSVSKRENNYKNGFTMYGRNNVWAYKTLIFSQTCTELKLQQLILMKWGAQKMNFHSN